MARKTLALRKGLTVEELRKGCWANEPSRYTTEYELTDVVDEAVELVLQRLIDKTNGGETIHRRHISDTCCQVAAILKALKDVINDRIRREELTPTLLDEVAGA